MDEPVQLHKENQQLRSQVGQLQAENHLLRQKLDALARRMFGKKSEQLNTAQLELLLGGPSESDADPAAGEPDEERALPERRQRRRKTQRMRTPEDLEVVREIIEPDLVSARPADWKQIGQEVSRRLDYQPGKFFWHETVRPKYVRLDNRDLPPLMAPAPPQVIEGGVPATGLLVHILVSRFCDHLPYYRLSDIFQRRHQVHIPRQQMVQWVAGSVRLLAGITACLLKELRASPYVQVDETPIKYLDPTRGGGSCQGYLWTVLVPGLGIFYQWHASRSANCLIQLLGEDFTGHLQSDGYSAYPVYTRSRDDVHLVGCWAHARRKFHEATDQAPRIVGWILNQIGWLYQWERELRESHSGANLRAAVRSARSQMVLDRLGRAIEKLQPRYLPQSLLGKALGYARRQWRELSAYANAGHVEIDNNLVENAIRPTAIGKKNWLFMGSEEAGERNAVIYTLVANCRMHGIEPYEYLTDVMRRLPTTTNQEVDQLTPLNWQQNRQASLQAAA